ncbi:MAG: phosphoribosylamine--glycine ligase [Verrucomicrobia bacterium]|nr:phosphoribosylamine--glycine ligase [Verrucomicrobiota bacterium]
MARHSHSTAARPAVMVFGVGAFTHSVMRILREDGARVSAYLTRDYGHYGPSLEGPVYRASEDPTPFRALDEQRPDLVVPMAIEWALQPWTEAFLARGVPFLCATHEALQLERDRDFARSLCRKYRIPFPEARVMPDRQAALAFVRRRRRPFVLKNPLCSPFSPLHTIVCETPEETEAWIGRANDAEGIFLQEYLGRAEAGHIAMVSGGEIYSLVTNQEYKRAFEGNQGIVAGAPLGGLVEADPGDRYGLARELLHPLRPWMRRVRFHGPVQVTAIRHRRRWHVLEYNVRLGVTSGALLLRLLDHPLAVLRAAALDQPLRVRFRPGVRFGCSITLAGYGYPYVALEGPRVPVRVEDRPTCDLWWNEAAAGAHGTVWATGHRIADVAAVAATLPAAVALACNNIRRLHSAGSYYRRDVGQSLWPPGAV